MKQCSNESAKRVFARRLSALIQLHGMTQAQLADDLGITPQTISSYVKGKTTPDYDMLRNIAIRLEISIDFLLGR